jgi:hypothetical protein
VAPDKHPLVKLPVLVVQLELLEDLPGVLRERLDSR